VPLLLSTFTFSTHLLYTYKKKQCHIPAGIFVSASLSYFLLKPEPIRASGGVSGAGYAGAGLIEAGAEAAAERMARPQLYSPSKENEKEKEKEEEEEEEEGERWSKKMDV
jgi:hypothetical protein